ncbi:hypothetical protein DEIPH_ctg009orf0013 [Deinococcus phoenicis]|uniref:Secreted protein n=1 Tax=Deinococcus phoenicis TaxID=1476583 RepID=A0A016QTZ8_9DEIO|nr:hypothetical protein [Deinococcus phoenicis]EYB69274.1 hypothetical protein DEIPH_ctg009orf0013 [Deinococcus phoenicis]
MTAFATHHEFLLPLGYADAAGRLHTRGVMRLATALDEVEPLGDVRVKDNEAFFGILLLSRVTLQLGEFAPVPPEVIAGLYAADFAYLQAFYAAINAPGSGVPVRATLPLPAAAPPASIETVCPQCGAELILDLEPAPLPDTREVTTP